MRRRPEATPPDQRHPQDARRELFLCGVGRSGTTALARCLNHHPQVVMGIERYARVLTVAQCCVDYRALFEKKRFFAFEPSYLRCASA